MTSPICSAITNPTTFFSGLFVLLKAACPDNSDNLGLCTLLVEIRLWGTILSLILFLVLFASQYLVRLDNQSGQKNVICYILQATTTFRKTWILYAACLALQLVLGLLFYYFLRTKCQKKGHLYDSEAEKVFLSVLGSLSIYLIGSFLLHHMAFWLFFKVRYQKYTLFLMGESTAKQASFYSGGVALVIGLCGYFMIYEFFKDPDCVDDPSSI